MTQVPGPLPAAPPQEPPARPGSRRGRVLRAGLLVTALAAVVALDLGVVPLPMSSRGPVVRSVAQGTGVQGEQVDLAVAKARETAIRTTLDAATRSFADGDATAAAALVAPGAPATSRVLGAMATNLHAVPGMEASIVWEGLWSTTSADADPDTGMVTANLRTFVRGYDTAPGVVGVDIGMKRSGDRWLVTTWAWDREAEPPPWTLTGLVAVAKPHVLVLGQAKNAGVNGRLAARAEAAVTDVRRLWAFPEWNGKAVVVAVTDRPYLAAWFGPGEAGPGQEHSDWHYVTTTNPTTTSYEVSGLRAVLATDYLLHDDRKVRAQLRFTFTLLSLQTTFAPHVLPAWLYYGSADYTGWRAQGPVDGLETLRAHGLDDRTWVALRRGTWKPAFTVDTDDFGSGSDAKATNDWDTAFLATTYIADRFGERALRALVIDICNGTAAVDAVPRHLHITEKQLEAGVRVYARTLAARA